jgi:hypothetical protein
LVWSRCIVPKNSILPDPRAPPSRRATSFFRNSATSFDTSPSFLWSILHCFGSFGFPFYCYCIVRFPVCLSFQSLDRRPNIYERPSTTVMLISAEGSVVPSSSSVSSFPHRPLPAQALRRLGFSATATVSSHRRMHHQSLRTDNTDTAQAQLHRPRVAPILTQDRLSCFELEFSPKGFVDVPCILSVCSRSFGGSLADSEEQILTMRHERPTGLDSIRFSVLRSSFSAGCPFPPVEPLGYSLLGSLLLLLP